MRRLRRGTQLSCPFRGNNLAELRIAKNMTQKELAQRIGIPRSTYAHIELGTYLPTREMLEDICRSLACSASDVYPPEVLSMLL